MRSRKSQNYIESHGFYVCVQLADSLRTPKGSWPALLAGRRIDAVMLHADARTPSQVVTSRNHSRSRFSQAAYNALTEGLPETPSVLERRLNRALTDHLPRSVRRRP
jgi:hypothetical protein